MRPLLLLLVTALSIIGLGTSPAFARAACGGGFSETTVSAALSTYPGFEAAIREGDSDGDGSLCVKVVSGRPQFVDD